MYIVREEISKNEQNSRSTAHDYTFQTEFCRHQEDTEEIIDNDRLSSIKYKEGIWQQFFFEFHNIDINWLA